MHPKTASTKRAVGGRFTGESEDPQGSRCTSDHGSRKANLEKQGLSSSCDNMRRWWCGPVLTPYPYLLSQRPKGLPEVSLNAHARYTLHPAAPRYPCWGPWTRPVRKPGPYSVSYDQRLNKLIRFPQMYLCPPGAQILRPKTRLVIPT